MLSIRKVCKHFFFFSFFFIVSCLSISYSNRCSVVISESCYIVWLWGILRPSVALRHYQLCCWPIISWSFQSVMSFCSIKLDMEHVVSLYVNFMLYCWRQRITKFCSYLLSHAFFIADKQKDCWCKARKRFPSNSERVSESSKNCSWEGNCLHPFCSPSSSSIKVVFVGFIWSIS